MPSRHRARERALQMIFQWEASREEPSKVIDKFWGGLAAEIGEEQPKEDAFANQLLLGVARQSKSLDELIRKHAANWRLERMAAVDRNILRMAIFEMRGGETPPAIVINEALELGRRYSGDQSARFLNGVLDAIRKTLEEEAARATP
ncbi:MAG: transcription antitermination factor NusB [Bryobacterales bacterium]